MSGGVLFDAPESGLKPRSTSGRVQRHRGSDRERSRARGHLQRAVESNCTSTSPVGSALGGRLNRFVGRPSVTREFRPRPSVAASQLARATPHGGAQPCSARTRHAGRSTGGPGHDPLVEAAERVDHVTPRPACFTSSYAQRSSRARGRCHGCHRPGCGIPSPDLRVRLIHDSRVPRPEPRGIQRSIRLRGSIVTRRNAPIDGALLRRVRPFFGGL